MAGEALAVGEVNVRLAVQRATDEGLAELSTFLKRSIATDADCSTNTLVDYDEQFHEGVVALTGNAEMLRTLRQINARLGEISNQLKGMGRGE